MIVVYMCIVHTCTYAHKHTYTCMCTFDFMYVHVHMNVCAHKQYVHVYIWPLIAESIYIYSTGFTFVHVHTMYYNDRIVTIFDTSN